LLWGVLSGLRLRGVLRLLPWLATAQYAHKLAHSRIVQNVLNLKL
jgi:hypothetical protein